MSSPNFQLTSLSKLFLDLKAELKAVSGETRVSVDNCVNRILSKDIFLNIEQTKPGLNNEIQLTDAIQDLISNQDVFALEFEGRRFDCGSKEGYISAIIDRASSINKYKSIIEK